MKYPNLKEEKKLWKKGIKRIVCSDEAGRGPLAGPVVAAAVMLNSKFKIQNAKLKFKIQNLRDSKKLTAKQREEWNKIITKNPKIKWGIGKVSEKVIDKINIFEATKLAMVKALNNLIEKLKNKKINPLKRTIVRISGKGIFLILDGNFTLPAEALAKMGINPSIPQKSIIKADEKVFSCAAASILAKVTRDRIMMCYHKKYPKYRFDLHKGYPTKFHLKMLKKYGPCKIHRKSFGPVRTCRLK
jgi:ribonuclease HII